MTHKRSSSSSSRSSSSSSGSDSKHKYKPKKDKRDKKHDKHEKDKHHGYDSSTGMPSFPPTPPLGLQHSTPSFSPPLQPPTHGMQFPNAAEYGAHSPFAHQPHAQDDGFNRAVSPQFSPPAYEQAPPSGFRVPLSGNAAFPPRERVGQTPCLDADGVSPVYFGSAIFTDPDSVHPCKVAPHLSHPCRVPYGGGEREHHGRYDLLPFAQDMKLIPASDGIIPAGCHPVEGGYETQNGRHCKLYHAVATINGVQVPGKCGDHLGGANVPFGNAEVYAKHYQLLVWKER